MDHLATESRDKLGLIHHQHGSFLLRLNFAASSLAKLESCEVARPTFSDLGNSHFRVRQSSKRAEEYYAAGWGATVHLAKFGPSAFDEITGVAERISSSLPLSGLDSLDVTFLGKVEGNRGTTNHDDDEAFAHDSQDGRTAVEIRTRLLTIVG